MSINATRGTSSQFQVPSSRSEPSSSPQLSLTQRPQSNVAREPERDSFTECPCKAKKRQVALNA